MDTEKLDMKEKPEINIMEESKATQAHLEKVEFAYKNLDDKFVKNKFL